MDEPKLSAEDVAAVIGDLRAAPHPRWPVTRGSQAGTRSPFANRATYERYLAEGLSEDEALWQTWKNRHKDE